MLLSITEPIIDFATNVVSDVGLPGIFGLMALDAACIPTSSEAIMLFAGFEVSDGRFTLGEVVVAGVAGNMVGSWIAYGIGYFGRVELLEKHGKWVMIKHHHIAWADRYFERHGSWTVFLTRMMPVVRTFISLPAGVARMPFWRFTWLSFAGIVPWVLGFALVGQEVGDNWESLKDKLDYVDYAVIVGVVGWIAYMIVRRRRGGDRPNAQSEPPAPAAPDRSS